VQEGNGSFDEDLHPAVVHGRSKEEGYLMLRVHFQGGGEDEWMDAASPRLCKPLETGSGQVR
jgi:hypothetical protein